MPLHPVITGHPAWAEVAKAEALVQERYERLVVGVEQAKAAHRAAVAAALEAGEPIPPAPAVPSAEDLVGDDRHQASERRYEFFTTHATDIQEALEVEEARLFDAAAGLLEQLDAVAADIQALLHAQGHLITQAPGAIRDRWNGSWGREALIAGVARGERVIGQPKLGSSGVALRGWS